MSNSSLQGLFQRKTVFWKSFIFCREPLQTQSDARNLEKAVPQLAWPHASKCHLCNIDSALDDAKEPWFEQRSLPFSYHFTKKGGHSQVLRIVMQFLTEGWREADRLRELRHYQNQLPCCPDLDMHSSRSTSLQSCLWAQMKTFFPPISLSE